ncbi:MAG: class I tRNA ligase family protein, partial [Candidatus Kapabacteria bacterium]|nr:class I tRNA ligase family protein [Candidatus Kapabacteria bacterium]MDW8225950.1 class I tRNA ligase family protein [Bacteroidota bacterium]
TVQFVHKYWDGRVPKLSAEDQELCVEWSRLSEAVWDGGESSFSMRWRPEERVLIQELLAGAMRAAQSYERFRFRDAVAETMAVARAANKFFNDAAPWRTITDEPQQSARTLFFCVQVARSLAILFSTVMPFAARRLWHLLQQPAYVGEPGEPTAGTDFWRSATLPEVPPGHRLADPCLLFARLSEQRIEQQRLKLRAAASVSEAPAQHGKTVPNAYATVEELQRLGLRIGRIVAAEPIAETQKLMCLQVELGSEKRQIVAGIAQRYKPEELIGRTIVVATNLKPMVIRGVESQGMLLAATAPDGAPVLLVPETEVPSGAEVR